MKRLTVKADDGTYAINKRYTAGNVQEVVDRLAAYEDTGLEPEEIRAMAENAETRLLTWCEGRYGFSVGTVMDLLEAKQDGRLVVLPCKVGDTVYCILKDSPVYYPDTDGWYISEETVCEITTKGLILDEIEDGASVYVYSFDQVGKTVFLTREEAERALEGQE